MAMSNASSAVGFFFCFRYCFFLFLDDGSEEVGGPDGVEGFEGGLDE
jgi:hypothetical protein